MALAGLLAMAALANPASACSCIRRPAAEIIRDTAAIFEARVLEVRISTRWSATLDAVVEPTDIWKGAVPDRAVLRSSTSSAICGMFSQRPVVGATLLARAGQVDEDGAFLLSGCTFVGDATSLPTLYGPQSERRRLDAAVAAAPGSLAPLFDRARFRESWDPEGAAAAYAALARNHPELPAAHLGLGRTLRNAARVAEAVPALERAVALNPTDPEAARLLAQARYKLGDAAAIETLRDFRDLRIDRLDVTGRDMRGADFSGAIIKRLIARDANLQRARFRDMVILQEAELRGADLRHADLTAAEIPIGMIDGANFDRARLDRARMRVAAPEGVSLRHIRGEGMTLSSYAVIRVDFTGAHLSGATFAYLAVAGSQWRGANLRGANFRDTSLGSTINAAADLHGAVYNCRTRFPAGFDPTRRGMVAAPEACTPR